MSNCIELHNCEVEFTEDEFDVEAYIKVMENSKVSPKAPSLGDNFAWFLADNSIVKANTNGTKSIIIRFGRGRSSHTWRDFRWVVWYLNQFIKKPKAHIFTAADEGDGFDNLFPLEVNWPYSSYEEVFNKI